MNKKLLIRKTHRWLAIIIGIQLLFWTVSGAYFSLVHIKTVRGEDRTRDMPAQPLPESLSVITPAQALQTARTQISQPLDRLSLQMDDNQLVYAVFSQQKSDGRWPVALVDAVSGQLRPPLSTQQAQTRALADYAGKAPVKSVVLLQDKAPSEYKGPLPVWQIVLDDARATHLYVSPVDGQILARRNSWWRTFDFLWMLHILDFDQRADFNNLLLRSIAPAAVFVVLSGYVLWWISRRRKPTVKKQEPVNPY